MVSTKFILRNAEDLVFRAMLYISPNTVPNTDSGNVVVGNSIKVAIGGSNIDPVIPLYPAPYAIRVVGAGFETQFNIDLTNAPSDTIVLAADYIVAATGTSEQDLLTLNIPANSNMRYSTAKGMQWYNPDTGLWHTKIVIGNPPQDAWDAGEL